MKEFLVTLFIDNIIVNRKMTELLDMCNGGILPKQLYNGAIDLIFPFYKEDDSVLIDLQTSSFLEIYTNGKQTADSTIKHGDYISIKDSTQSMVYSLLFVDTSMSSFSCKKMKLEKSTNIFIGRFPENNICYDINDSISRKHAAIRFEADGTAYIEDLSRKAGVYVNGIRINTAKLNLFDEIFIMGLVIVYIGEYIAINNLNLTCNLKEQIDFNIKNPTQNSKSKTHYFVRSPRILKSLETGVFEIDPPPSQQKTKKMPIILTLGPSLTMAIATIAGLGFSIGSIVSGGSMSSAVASGAMTVSMLLGSIMWPNILNNYQKRQEISEEKYRREKYTQYICKKDNEIKEKYNRNARILNEILSPSPQVLSQFLDSKENSIRLWERTVNDSDFLSVRVGKGERSFDVEIRIPKEGFVLYDDDLFHGPRQIYDTYYTLKDVPITISLIDQKTVGLIGKRRNINDISKNIILNIAALHSYDEVKLVFIYNQNESKEFEWVRELPHTWSTDRSIRYTATTPQEVHHIFSIIDEVAKEREQDKSRETGIVIPHFIFFIADQELVENEALLRYIENPNNTAGISSLFLSESITTLPKDCSVIIQSDDSVCGIYSKNKFNNKFINFIPDEVDVSRLQVFADKLSSLPVKIDSRNLSVPNRVSFLQLYRTGNVAGLEIERKWNNNNSDRSLAAPIGIKAGGEAFSLDIHEGYHGCHGLVAGMTGSGKSEFLQAYILSLLVNYSPNEIAFVLVDFKGGDMARPFMEKPGTATNPYTPSIPHLAATISNLSGNILYRALVSLEAEIKTRQNAFNKAASLLGIDKIDINSYHRYFKEGKLKTPLPHLIIIIDEFAQLKTQQPEFLAQLINVAQVGRSLGIHLILATQKPSGVVDPQIWSNARFRVSLKVLDKQDSIEMINRPDAAMIKLPGRCYIQVGYDEVFEYLQSGYSGADYIASNVYYTDDEITVNMVDNTATPIRIARNKIGSEKSGRSQLEEVVRDIVALGVKKNIRVKPLWCPVLKPEVFLNDVADVTKSDAKSSLKVNIALGDFIKSQQQLPISVDFMKYGHLAIYGASGTGKTTFIQTLIYSLVTKYTPDEVNMYVFDFGGRSLGYLNALPHCGGVVFSDDEERISKTIETVSQIIEERKLLFSKKNCSSYGEYLNAANEKLPAVILVVDNYSPFREKFYNMEEDFVNIISTGKAYGIFVVLTGNSKNAIYYKATEHISCYFTLRMNDPMNYRDILNVAVPIEPENIKGRGITVVDNTVIEFQTALALPAETEAQRTENICKKFDEISKQWKGKLPIQICVSEDVKGDKRLSASKQGGSKDSYAKKTTNPPDAIEVTPHTLIIGSSLTGTINYGVELSDFRALYIGYKENSDGIDVIKALIENSQEFSNRKIIIFDNEKEALKPFAQGIMNCRYINTSNDFDDFIKDLQTHFNERKARLEEMLKSSLSNETIYGNMFGFEKWFILINGFADFYDMISDEAAERFTYIVRESQGLGLYYMTVENLQKLSAYSSLELYKYLIKADAGIICDGYIDLEHSGFLCDDMLSISASLGVGNKKNEGYLFYSKGRFTNILC